MWAVSDRFLSALGKPHRLVTEATVTAPGGDPVPLSLTGGSVEVDGSANLRRTCSLSLVGGRDVYELVTTPGAVVRIEHGIDYGRDQELVPVFTGEVVPASQVMGENSISLRGADLNRWLDRARFLTPYSPTAGTERTTVIHDLVVDARPGSEVAITATDAGSVQSQVWDEDRLRAINDLTKDGGTEAFWAPDGTYQVRDRATLASAPVWTIRAGTTGVLTGAERARSMDRMYNTVVVKPSATDGSQTWEPQVVQVTDPDHPRHPDRIGVVPYFWASPTAATAADALAAGWKILDRVLGNTETLRLGAISNPALEAEEVIRVITPGVGREPAAAFTHFIDGFSIDLSTGAMSLNTRSAGDVDA